LSAFGGQTRPINCDLSPPNAYNLGIRPPNADNVGAALAPTSLMSCLAGAAAAVIGAC